jgi:hypothetical protein
MRGRRRVRPLSSDRPGGRLATMAYCSHCGSELERGAGRCGSCGTNRAGAGWALATEVCSECDEPTARGWRHCVTCGTPTAVFGRGRSVRVEASQVRSWFTDLLPVDERSPTETKSDSAEPDTALSAASPPVRSQPRPQVTTRPRSPYTSPALAAGTAQRALLSTALMAVIAAGTLLALNDRLAAFKRGAPESFDAAVTVAGLADWGTRPLAILALVLSLWYLMRWTAIVYSNIFSFGKTSLRLPPTAVPWAFFVPGFNLLVPPRLINDAWRAADPSSGAGQDWMLQPGNRWTTATWGAATISIVLHAVGWTVGSASVDAAIAANRWAAAGWGAATVAAGAAVLTVQRVTEHQERRHRELTAGGPTTT